MKKTYLQPQIEETTLTLHTGVMSGGTGTPDSGNDIPPVEQGGVHSPARIFM